MNIATPPGGGRLGGIFGVGNTGSAEGGAVSTLVGGATAIGWIATAFLGFVATPYLGAFIIAFIVLCFAVMMAMPPHGKAFSAIEIFGAYCFVGALVCVAFGGVAVLGFHWVSYTLVGWFVTGLYGAGLLLTFLKKINALLGLVSILFGIGMATALVMLPTPSGALPPDDPAHRWRIALSVRDANGEPVQGTLSNCAAVMRWDLEDAAVFRSGSGTFTDDQGKASFTFHEDVRLKAGACIAFKPSTQDQEGYAPRTNASATLIPGDDVRIEIVLDERSPPGPPCTWLQDSADHPCQIRLDGASYEIR
jgi:hypothetical protein